MAAAAGCTVYMNIDEWVQLTQSHYAKPKPQSVSRISLTHDSEESQMHHFKVNQALPLAQ